MNNNIDAWKYIWLKPRLVFRYFFDNESIYCVWILATLGGVAWEISDYDNLNSASTLISLVCSGSIVGMFRLFIGSWILQLSGSLLKGNASRKDLARVWAWSSAPDFFYIIATFYLVTCFTDVYDSFDSIQNIWHMIIGSVLVATIVVSVIWSYIILIAGVSEAQGFTLVRSFFSVLISVSFVLFFLLSVNALIALAR